jgi:branched-chain amino acid aminotransferase
VIDEILVTPDLSSGCLAGITRELVIEVEQVEERSISLQELSGASEAFLTSSTRDISPVSSLGEIAFPDTPGPITVKVAKKFAELVASNPDP